MGGNRGAGGVDGVGHQLTPFSSSSTAPTVASESASEFAAEFPEVGAGVIGAAETSAEGVVAAAAETVADVDSAGYSSAEKSPSLPLENESEESDDTDTFKSSARFPEVASSFWENNEFEIHIICIIRSLRIYERFSDNNSPL